MYNTLLLGFVFKCIPFLLVKQAGVLQKLAFVLSVRHHVSWNSPYIAREMCHAQDHHNTPGGLNV